MPRKADAVCMFCFGDGCEVCTKPTKKASKKVAAAKPKAAPIAPEPVAKTDIKAAMKSVAVSQVKQKEEDDGSVLDALVALEPLLHPDELAKISDDLDAYKSPAERWRWRREQRGL